MNTKAFIPFLSLVFLNSPSVGNAKTVEVVTAEVREIRITTSQPAFVQAYYSADIGSRVSGVAETVLVDIGQQVKAGDRLAVIDAPDLHRQRDALIAEARVAETNLAAEKANLEAVEAETQRILNLVKNNSVTAKAGDEANKKALSAKAQYNAAEASLDAAKARLAEAEAKVSFTILKAPFDGVVTQRELDPGDLVVGNQAKSLFQIVQTDKLRIVIHVPEKDTHLLDAGDPVELSFNSLPSRSVLGNVARMSMALNPKTQRMRVEVDLEGAAVRLFPGSYGQAIITLEKKPKAVTIPAGTLRFKGDKPMVYLVSGGKVVHQAVNLGVDHGSWVEVTSGLNGGEQIITGTIDRLPAGTVVELR